MKINKKIIASFLIVGFLVAFGGLAIAEDTITQNLDLGDRQFKSEQKLENRHRHCCGNNSQPDREVKRHQDRQDNRALRTSYCNDRLDGLVDDNIITGTQADAIKGHFDTLRSGHRVSEHRGNGARLMQDSAAWQKLIDDKLITSEQAENIRNSICIR